MKKTQHPEKLINVIILPTSILSIFLLHLLSYLFKLYTLSLCVSGSRFEIMALPHDFTAGRTHFYFKLSCLILYILVLSTLFLLCACYHVSTTNGPISLTQLKILDLATIRPRILLWLGADNTGLDAVSMITAYEEFLYSLNTPDAVSKVPTEPKLPTSDAALVQLNQHNVIYPPPKNILDENLAASPLIQLARQRLREWIELLNSSYSEYYNSLDLRFAKKGAAAGYNALLSGPTMSDIPKISEKMKSLLDILYEHRNQ